MSKPTAEAIMGDLHVMTTNRLLEKIKDEDSDPRFVQMAIKFLADNKVTMVIEISNDLGELDKHLQKKKKRFEESNITDFATAQAEAMNE